MVEQGCEADAGSGATDEASGDPGLTNGQPQADQPSLYDLVVFLARNLVTQPDAVHVSEVTGESASVFELRVAKEDLGRVIGKQGRTAKSLRTLLNAAASRVNAKAALDIVEE